MKKNIPISGDGQQRPDSPGPHSRYGRPHGPAQAQNTQGLPYGEQHVGKPFSRAPHRSGPQQGREKQDLPYGEYHTGRRPVYPIVEPGHTGAVQNIPYGEYHTGKRPSVPNHVIPPIPPMDESEWAHEEVKPKSGKALPILIGVIVLLCLAAGGIYFMRNRAIKMQAQKAKEDYAKRVSTNAYRTSSRNLKNAVAGLFDQTAGLGDALVGSEEIEFREFAEQLAFVNNEKDIVTAENETLDSGNMGRVVFPSIDVNGPLMAGENEEHLNQGLVVGFGIVNYQASNPEAFGGILSTMSQPGQTTILGHRCLYQNNSFYYLHEVEVGDPYYIDDYQLGKRFYYQTVSTKGIPEEELNNYVFADPNEVSPEYGKAIKDGQFTLLVVCDPLVFESSERRILVFGELADSAPIPKEDPWYQRYLNDHGIELADEENEETTNEAAEESATEDATADDQI